MERRSLNQTAALIFGAIYALIGIIGFFITGFDDFATGADGQKETLLGFAINPLHNIVHLLVGLFLLGGARAGHRAARSANLTVGAAYAVVFVLGLFLANKDTAANFLNLNTADNFLHIGTTIVLLAVGLLADKSYRTAEGNLGAGPGATRM